MSRASRLLSIERKILTLLHKKPTLTQLKQIHAYIVKNNLNQCNQILSHFISICSSLNNMSYAHRIFLQTRNPNIFVFNSMIKGSSLPHQDHKESFFLFSLMKSESIWPDEYTLSPLLKACTGLCDLGLGKCVHKDVLVSGFEHFGSIEIGLVEFYSSVGGMEDCVKVFDEMHHRDVIAWNLLINGYFKRGDGDMGLRLFREMRERSVVSWNIVIGFLARTGRDSETLEVFREMLDSGFSPDEATMVTVLPVCAHLGNFHFGEKIHSFAESSGLYQGFVSVGNALMDFYCKSGALEKAREIFNNMPEKNVVSWNVLISGMAFNGKGEAGVELFEEMLSEGFISPNDATFIAVLSCCAHTCMVKKGNDLFYSMSKNHNLEPKVEHYGCMVDLLGRSGCVREAYNLIKSMPGTTNVAIWGSLLSACRTHGDMELAHYAVKELIELEPWSSGNYVLLSNMYAEEKRWNEVEKVRILMRERCVQKVPGQSIVA